MADVSSRRGQSLKDGARGFILAESMFSIAVLSIAIVALVPTFLLSLKANKAAEQTKAATQLSTELLEEIRLRRWDDLTPLTLQAIATGSAALGIDSSENAADKRTFDDVDDFNGWSENPPTDPMMQPIAGLGGYSRNVAVSYVNASLTAAAGPTDYKQATVCTKTPKGVSVCLATLFTNR